MLSPLKIIIILSQLATTSIIMSLAYQFKTSGQNDRKDRSHSISVYIGYYSYCQDSIATSARVTAHAQKWAYTVGHSNNCSDLIKQAFKMNI